MLEAVKWKDHLKEMRDPVWLSFHFCNNLRSQANRVLPIAMLLSPVTSVDLKCLRVKPNTAAPTHHHHVKAFAADAGHSGRAAAAAAVAAAAAATDAAVADTSADTAVLPPPMLTIVLS